MARTRAQPKPEEELTPEQEHEAERAVAEPESEVRAEEFTRGTDEPAWQPPFPEAVVAELRKPLDPNRIRRRQGRGSGQFEYLAGHDVKRRMNEIFGFGNWGTKLVELRELHDAIPVRSTGDNPRDGWHVGYVATVRVSIRTSYGDWVSYEDSGYGDGAEYGAAALITARELAVKESVTDAFKRASTYLGDQFGLILYAKGDEKARIAREANVSEQQAEAVRVEHQVAIPKNWTEANTRFDALVGEKDQSVVWVEELVEKRFGASSIRDLSAEDRQKVWVGYASTLVLLEEQYGDLAFNPKAREIVRKAFALRNEGVELEGPAWRISPEEQDRPEKAS